MWQRRRVKPFSRRREKGEVATAVIEILLPSKREKAAQAKRSAG